jgi:DNA replicative helicase MCM subunit Mcm2 (Cdc46/Mcm family)
MRLSEVVTAADVLEATRLMKVKYIHYTLYIHTYIHYTNIHTYTILTYIHTLYIHTS